MKAILFLGLCCLTYKAFATDVPPLVTYAARVTSVMIMITAIIKLDN